MTTSTVLLVAGYAAAVPVTVFVPGFLRLWRRREPLLYAAAQGGACLIVAGWLARGSIPTAVFNLAWVVGFGVAYAVEGRKRAA